MPMRLPSFTSVTTAVLTLLMTLAVTNLLLAAEDDYEAPPSFKASEILSITPELLEGEHFKVREDVANDGYWDYYIIDTPWGEFQAHGWLSLRKMVREIEAIGTIEGMTKTAHFTDSVIDAGLEPVETAAQIIIHPIQTAKHLPTGIKHMFQRYGRRAKKVMEVSKKIATGDRTIKDVDPRMAEACASGEEPYPGACDEEGYVDDLKDVARRYFDVSEAMRELHRDLGTDPYTSNEVLYEAVKKISWVGGLGQYGTRKANPLRQVEAVGLANKVYRFGWSMEPFEFRAELDKILIENGIPAKDRVYFLNNPYLTPTKQAFIVMSLQEMDDVEGRANILDWAADSRNEDEAVYSAASVALAAWYHARHPVKRFLPDAILPTMETQDGAIISLMPIDHLSWTEEVAVLIEAALERPEFQTDAPKTVWLMNRSSERAKEEIRSRGFEIYEDGYKDLLASNEYLEFDGYPEDWTYGREADRPDLYKTELEQEQEKERDESDR